MEFAFCVVFFAGNPSARRAHVRHRTFGTVQASIGSARAHRENEAKSDEPNWQSSPFFRHMFADALNWFSSFFLLVFIHSYVWFFSLLLRLPQCVSKVNRRKQKKKKNTGGKISQMRVKHWHESRLFTSFSALLFARRLSLNWQSVWSSGPQVPTICIYLLLIPPARLLPLVFLLLSILPFLVHHSPARKLKIHYMVHFARTKTHTHIHVGAWSFHIEHLCACVCSLCVIQHRVCARISVMLSHLSLSLSLTHLLFLHGAVSGLSMQNLRDPKWN